MSWLGMFPEGIPAKLHFAVIYVKIQKLTGRFPSQHIAGVMNK